MSDDEIIAIHFPGAELRIAQLRAIDRGFDEICRDLITMHREFVSLTGAEGHQAVKPAAIVAESVLGLRTEIQARLECAGHQPAPGRQRP